MKAAARSTVLAITSIAALLVAREASANGRYPASGQIALNPSNEKVMLVRATYGLMFSTDAGDDGAGWGWICEPAVGYGGEEDPMMSFTADGTLLAGIFEGLSVGSTDACSWTFAGGGLANKYVVDLAVDKVTPSNAVLLISNNVGVNDAGAPTYLSQLWQTSDNGKTWAQSGVNLPPLLLGLTVDTAPSDATRVYVSGQLQPPSYVGTIERSDDRGATWQSLPIPGADQSHLPYIGGVDPTHPDVLYVRLDSDPSDTLLASKDGGMTWTTVFTAQGKLNGFAISPDGSKVAIGSPGVTVGTGTTTMGAGIWTAPSSTLAFTQVSKVGALCLTWGATGLYACADQFTDGFTAGVSTDQGKTFTPILHLSELCGPLACGSSTSVGQQCPAIWPSTQMTISASCPGVDGGAGGSSASSSTSSASSGGPSSPTASSSKGCSCSLSSLTSGQAGAAAFLALLAAGALRGRGGWRARRPSR